jgi:hypothetical protein
MHSDAPRPDFKTESFLRGNAALTDPVILVDVIRYNQCHFLLFHVIYEVFCSIASQIVGKPDKTLYQVF